MNITLTETDYRLLLDMLYLAEWVINARTTTLEDPHPEYQALKKKLYAYAKSVKVDDRIEYAPELDEYVETSVYEKRLRQQFLNEYEEDSFWDSLCQLLAARDLIEQIGLAAYESMNPAERLAQLEGLKGEYAIEFSVYGLSRLSIRVEESIDVVRH